MDLESPIVQMEHNAQAIKALVQDVSDHQAHWQPEPDTWSLLDVINHLAYEERHDFWNRLDLVLHRPQEPWPSGDSARGVTEHSRERGLEESVDSFLMAREEALAWLRALETPNWDAACDAPFGEIKAGDIMASWAAHDLLHLRQLIEMHWAYLVREVKPYGIRYAGDW